MSLIGTKPHGFSLNIRPGIGFGTVPIPGFVLGMIFRVLRFNLGSLSYLTHSYHTSSLTESLFRIRAPWHQ